MYNSALSSADTSKTMTKWLFGKKYSTKGYCKNIMSNNTEITLPNIKDLSEQISRNREQGWPDLAAKDKLFLHKFIETYVIKDAASACGMSAVRGGQVLREPLAMAYLNELQNIQGQRSIISRDFVNIQWIKLLPKLMGEEEVAMIDKDSIQFMAKKFHSADVVRTLTELSKSTNFYADGSGQSAAVNINIDLGALGIKTDEKVINP